MRTAWLAVLFASLTLTVAAPVSAAPPDSAAVCFAVDVSGSNWSSSPTHPASDPGPNYVRSEVIRLVDALIGMSGPSESRFASFATFGREVRSVQPLTSVTDAAGRDALMAAIGAALQPTRDYTSVDRGLAACGDLLGAAPKGSRRTIVLMSDGRPDRPGAGTQAQLSAIRQQIAPQLREQGVQVDAVLYGDSASRPNGQAASVMRSIAEAAGGTLFLAPRGLDLLQVAVQVAASIGGLESQGVRTAASGSLTVPIDVPPHLAEVTLLAIRSNARLSLTIQNAQGQTLASTAGSGAASLLVSLTAPASGRYLVLATGTGQVYVAEVGRADTVTLPAPPAAPLPAAHPGPRTAPIAHLPNAGSRGWPALLAGGLSLLAVSGWILLRRRPVRGALVVWHGLRHRTEAVADLQLDRRGAWLPLSDLLPEGAEEAALGMRIACRGRSLWLIPDEAGPGAAGGEVQLLPDQPSQPLPGITVTHHPGGADDDQIEADRPLAS